MPFHDLRHSLSCCDPSAAAHVLDYCTRPPTAPRCLRRPEVVWQLPAFVGRAVGSCGMSIMARPTSPFRLFGPNGGGWSSCSTRGDVGRERVCLSDCSVWPSQYDTCGDPAGIEQLDDGGRSTSMVKWYLRSRHFPKDAREGTSHEFLGGSSGRPRSTAHNRALVGRTSTDVQLRR
jgi:hypothetical protein